MHPSPSRGFTLVELLLSIAIIGIIVAGAQAGFRASEAKKRDIKRITNVRELQKALALYLNQNGSYPVVAGGVCINGTDAVTNALRTQGAIAPTGKFADPEFPSDTTKCYFYTSASGSTYTIRYRMERDSSYGQAGTYNATP